MLRFYVPLFMFENFLKEDKSIVASSWFITSEKNNPILLLTRDLLYYYWKKNNFLMKVIFFDTVEHERYFVCQFVCKFNIIEHCFQTNHPKLVSFNISFLFFGTTILYTD